VMALIQAASPRVRLARLLLSCHHQHPIPSSNMPFSRSKNKRDKNSGPPSEALDVPTGSQAASLSPNEPAVNLNRFSFRDLFRGRRSGTPSVSSSASPSLLAIQGGTADPGAVPTETPPNNQSVLVAEQTPSPPQSTAIATPTTTAFQTTGIPGISSGNRIANLGTVLSIAKSICEMLDNIPFAKAITGALKEGVNIAQVSFLSLVKHCTDVIKTITAS
jgi:hypothetical protein